MPDHVDGAAPAPLHFFASARGGVTLDADAEGGNPFASALVELLGRGTLTLHALRAGMEELTLRNSDGVQRPELPTLDGATTWRVLPAAAGERRVALVLVCSAYPADSGMPPLPGATHDAGRVTASLRAAGFETRVALDRTRRALRATLARFASRSASADVALLYATGHGVDVGGVTYLLPIDYPLAERDAALARRALSFGSLADAVRATRRNLVFYAACRDDPFAPA